MQRSALAGGVAVAASAAVMIPPRLLGATNDSGITYTGDGLAPGQPGTDYQPIITPNNPKLPWKLVDGAKVFHLIAEEVEHDFTVASWPNAGATTVGSMGQRSRP